MSYIPQILFIIISAVAIWFFSKKIMTIRRNILLGKDADYSDRTGDRWRNVLLLAFGQKPGRVLSRDELTRVVTGRGAEPEDRSVDVLISRLRRKIEPDPKTPRLIVTVPG